MARRSRRSLEDFTKEIKLETFSEGIDLLDDTNLPPWQPLIDLKTKRPYTFHAFVDRFMPAIEPRWKGFDEAASFMAAHMEDAVNGRDQRYAFIPPPRAGKSLLGVALWIFNLTVVDGSQPVLFISASTQLATSHARKALKLFQATGNMLSPKSASVTSWMPDWSGGAEQAARGATSKVQGLGFGLGILDDACGGRPATQSSAHMEQIWSAYTSDWTSRGQLGASGKGNNLVVIEQRLSNQDLMQRIIDHENLAAKRGGGTPYHVIHLPIEHPHDLGAASTVGRLSPGER